MGDESVALEDSRHGSDAIMSVVLRRLNEGVESTTFAGRSKPSALFSPTKRLFAIHQSTGDLRLYTTLYDAEQSGHSLPGLATGKISNFTWTFLDSSFSPVLVTLSSSLRCIKVYQFLKDTFTSGEDVHTFNQAPNQDGKFFLRFQTEKAMQDDCNVVEYTIPFSSAFDGLQPHFQVLQAIDSVELLNNDPYGPNIILSINKGKFIMILRLTAKGFIFRSLLKFPSTSNLIDFCELGAWCFGLDTSLPSAPRVHVFNSLDGFYHGAIAVALDSKLSNPIKISVSSDLSTLVCYAQDSAWFQALDIDAYFLKHAPNPAISGVITTNLEKIGKAPISDEGEDLDVKTVLIDGTKVRSERMKYLRWYEEGDMRLWSQNGAPTWKAVLGSDTAQWEVTIKEYIAGEWVYLHAGTSVKSIDHMFITPTKIIVVGSAVHAGVSSVLRMLDRKDTSRVSGVEVKKPILILEEASMVAVYFFDDEKLCAFLPDQCSVKSKAMGVITSGLIIFDKPELAELLYQLNGWDKKMLKLQSLKLGLKYRQLDVIAPALLSLTEDEQLKGAELLLAFTQDHSQVVVQDEVFWSQLLKLSMEFVSSIMRSKSSNIASHPSQYLEITKYADILTVLRNTSLKLRELALKGSSAASFQSTSQNSSQHNLNTKTKTASSQTSPDGTTRPRSEKIRIGSATNPSTSLTRDSSLRDVPRRSISSSVKFSSSLDPHRDSEPSSYNFDSGLAGVGTATGTSASSLSGSVNSSASAHHLDSAFDESAPNSLKVPSSVHSGVGDQESDNTTSNRQSIDLSNSALDKKIQGLERKIDGMKEMSVSFEQLLPRWEKMRDVDIVADSLLNGNVSTALAYLQWTKTMKSEETSDDMDLHSRTTYHPHTFKTPLGEYESPFQYVLSLACHFIYQSVALRKLTLATSIINNLGEDFGKHMKDIAWHTSIKAIRNLLIPQLLEMGIFSESEIETVEFAQTLESAYVGTTFYPDQPLGEGEEALKADMAKTLKVANITDYDIDPFFISQAIATQPELLTVLNKQHLTPPTNEENQLSICFRLHYLHLLRTTDSSAKIRLLFDANLISNPQLDVTRLDDEEAFDMSPLTVSSLMAYFAAHNDWKRLAKWFIASLDRELAKLPEGKYGTLDENANLVLSSSDSQSIDTLLDTFNTEVGNKSMPESTERLIRGELAQRKIFVASDRASLANLLRVLAQSASVFRPSDESSEEYKITRPAVDISNLLPHGRVSPLHMFMIEQCVEMKLITLLSTYLNHYGLACTAESIKEIREILSNSLQGTGVPTWVTLLLNMRHQDTLFEASIVNAQIATRSKTPLTVSSMISSNTIKKRPLLALGTLMYAPVSLLECASAPKGVAWQLDQTQLSELCSAFPLVHKALFPSDTAGPQSHKTTPFQAQERLILPSVSFDIVSSEKDLNLHHLLTAASQFQLTPFNPIHMHDGNQYEETHELELSIQLDDPSFDELRFLDFADAAFFLCQGQPFKAYRWLLNHFARERTSNLSSSLPTTPNQKSRFNSSGGLGRPKPALRNTTVNSIPLHEAPKIMRMVRQVAFRNVFDDSIVASCVALLELCEYKSLDLKVDCRAIVRLAEFCSKSPSSIFEDFSLPSPAVGTSPATPESASTPQPSDKKAHLSRQETVRHLAQLLESALPDANPASLASSHPSILKDQDKSSCSPRETLVQLSKMLEKATETSWDAWLSRNPSSLATSSGSILSSSGRASNGSSGSSTSGASQSNDLSVQINMWSLLIFFNTVHKIPLGDAPLSYLAKANDWVSFLFYAQLLGYPAELAFKLCEHFTDVHLRDHLMLCLNQMIPDSKPIVLPPASNPESDSSEPKSTINQLFQAALAAGTNIYPGESLLQAAVSSKRSLFTVLALCFPDVTIVNCITVWLSIAVPLATMVESNSSLTSSDSTLTVCKELLEFSSNLQISLHSNAANRVTRLLKSTSAAAFSGTSTSAQSINKSHSLDTLYTVSRFVLVLCANTQVQFMIRAFEVFEPSHPLITFMRALQCFNQARFATAANLMSEFFKEIQSVVPGGASSTKDSTPVSTSASSVTAPNTVGNTSTQTRPLLLGDFNWIYQLVVEVCDTLVKWHMPTTFERREFLKMMSIAFPRKYEATYREFCLLEKMDLLEACMSPTLGFSLPSSQSILQELVKRSKFDDARHYAHFCGLNVHEVTILEAEDLLSRLKILLVNSRHNLHARNGSNATNSDQDLANERASIWRQINSLLLQRKCRPDVAGNFFLNHAQQLDYLVTGEPRPSVPIRAPFSNDTASVSLSGADDASSTHSSSDDEEDDEYDGAAEELLTVGQAAAEQIQLLSLARPWLEGAKNSELQMSPLDYVGQFVPAGGFDGNVNIWIPQEQLEFIHAKILRLSVLAQAESGSVASKPRDAHLKLRKPKSGVSQLTSSGSSTTSSSSGKRKTKTSLHYKLAKTDLSNVDPEVVESLIGKILNQSDSFEEAERTATDLGIQSRELTVVKTMIDLVMFATNGVEAKSLIEKNTTLVPLITAANPNLTIDYSLATVVDVLNYLARVSKHAFDCCDRIIARYKVSDHLGLAYDVLLEKNPFEVLQFLIQEGAPMLPLAKHYSTALRLDKERIALMLAELCYRAICDLEGNVSRLATSSSVTGNANFAARGSLGSDGESFVRSGSFFSPSVTPSNSVSDLSGLLSNNTQAPGSGRSIQTSKSSSSLNAVPLVPTAPQPLATFFSNKHWAEYVDLATPKASLVGDEILRLLSFSTSKPNFATATTTAPSGSASGSSNARSSNASGTASSVAYNVEIELIIRAFVGYRVGLDVLKQAKLFDLIEERVPIYVEAQQFKSLVRLITGIKLYAQLQYILDILVRFDCFDMLLSRNVYHLEDGDDRKELQLALFNFLKAHYPTHIDKMKLLFLRFSMFREHADLLQERGWMFLNTLKTKLEPNVLLQALDCFLEAASMYVKDMAYGLEAKCLDMANLIQLQFEIPDVRIVNLKESQAQLVLTHCPIFSHSLIVAKAYSLLKQSNWIEPIFNQVILNANWTFWSELEAQLPLERGLLFSKVIKRVKQELAAPTATNKAHFQLVLSNTRTFLDNLEDHYLRLKYARDLGLTDMIEQLSRVMGAEYTTLIIS